VTPAAQFKAVKATADQPVSIHVVLTDPDADIGVKYLVLSADTIDNATFTVSDDVSGEDLTGPNGYAVDTSTSTQVFLILQKKPQKLSFSNEESFITVTDPYADSIEITGYETSIETASADVDSAIASWLKAEARSDKSGFNLTVMDIPTTYDDTGEVTLTAVAKADDTWLPTSKKMTYTIRKYKDPDPVGQPSIVLKANGNGTREKTVAVDVVYSDANGAPLIGKALSVDIYTAATGGTPFKTGSHTTKTGAPDTYVYPGNDLEDNTRYWVQMTDATATPPVSSSRVPVDTENPDGPGPDPDPTTPSGSSGGGCDAGFAGVGLLLAAPLFLKKKGK
jgi:Synergist-CTERM protein sorting domain-containing protein